MPAVQIQVIRTDIMAEEKKNEGKDIHVRDRISERRQKRDRERRRRTIVIRTVLCALLALVVLLVGTRAVRYLVPSTNIRSSYTWEAGTERPAVTAFLKQNDGRASLTTDLSLLSLDVVGSYTVEIQIGENTYESLLNVTDTTAPQAMTQDLTTSIGVSVDAGDFIETIYDATQVSVSYAEDPDLDTIGQQEVNLLLTDSGGNTANVYAYLTVKEDGEAPVIEGVSDQTVYAGETISYKTGVTVTDNKDEDPELTVDNSEVDLETPGTYTVTYTATDSSGNTTSVTAQITVEEAPEGVENLEEMEETAQAILDSILTDDMDEEERLYTMYMYVKNHMSYTGSSDKSSYINEAIRGFAEGTGDCFTYYSMLKALMEQDGFETIDVEREGGETQHFWSLVWFNDAWYHIDSCSRRAVRNSTWLCFLRIDSELQEFSEYYGGYYNFDTDLYPATPTEVYNSEYIEDVAVDLTYEEYLEAEAEADSTADGQ